MSTDSRFSKAYENAGQIRIGPSCPVVIFSDCHRGLRNNNDDLYKNLNIYKAALKHYLENQYTYIELGDADELWENKHIEEIIQVNEDIYEMLGEFHRAHRLIMMYGNHDLEKKAPDYARERLVGRKKGCDGANEELFPGLELIEALILYDAATDEKLFLIHGHQGELINDTLWRLARFLVRYLWKGLELLGIKNPFSTAHNFRRCSRATNKYTDWAQKNNVQLVTGHTHRPSVRRMGRGGYYNSGSCVKPGTVIALEVVMGKISLVRWAVDTDAQGRLYVGRKVMDSTALCKSAAASEGSCEIR